MGRANKMFRFAVVVCSAALVAAEADPALLLGAGYTGLGYAGLGYTGLAGAAIAAPAIASTAYAAPIAVGKSAPCVNAANIPVPCNAGAALAAHALAAPAIATTGVIGGYSTLGGYYGKREAEAEPLILGNLGAGYSGLGFGHAGIDARPAAGLAQNFYPGAARVIAAPVIATTGVIGGYSTLGYSTYGKRET